MHAKERNLGIKDKFNRRGRRAGRPVPRLRKGEGLRRSAHAVQESPPPMAAGGPAGGRGRRKCLRRGAGRAGRDENFRGERNVSKDAGAAFRKTAQTVDDALRERPDAKRSRREAGHEPAGGGGSQGKGAESAAENDPVGLTDFHATKKLSRLGQLFCCISLFFRIP